MSLLDKVVGAPWAVMPETLGTIIEVVRREAKTPRAEWPKYSALDRSAKVAEGYRSIWIKDGVAVLPVAGVIIPRADLFAEISGATSLESAAADLARALLDPDVSAIVLDIDSPGGSVFGVATFADKVRAAGKPVVAYTDGLMASAALWIGAAARELVADKSASIGSVGVVGALSVQVAPDRFGELTFEIVSSGAPLKRLDPRTDGHIDVLRAKLDDYEAQFVGALAAFRGVSMDKVLADFGQGGTMIADRARQAGMIDRLGALGDAIARAKALSASSLSPAAAQSGARGAGAPPAAPITAHTGEPDMSEKTPQGGPTPPAATPAGPAPSAPVTKTEAEIKAEAIAADRARCKAIRAHTITGHEALAEKCMEEGSSLEQFLAAQTMAEKAKGPAYIEERRKAEGDLAKVAPKAATDPAPAPTASAVPASDEAAKKAYAADAGLRSEFAAEADYLAWAKAAREKRFKTLTR